METQKELLEITCEDQRVLAGRIYRSSGEVKGAVLIASATGIKKEFYKWFASHLAENGYPTLTFDFRGVGKSSLKKHKEDPASIVDWGEKDLTAALEELKRQYPNQQYHLFGHSAGGQLTGLMKNHDELSSQFNFACSTGNVNNMTGLFWYEAQFFLRFFIPLSNAVLGYSHLPLVGMGQPIPKKVAKQWSHWCLTKGYIKTAIEEEGLVHHYDHVKIPMMWAHSTDDPIANTQNVTDIAEIHSQAEVEIKALDAKDFGLKEIGHMGFYTRRTQQLWPVSLDWLARSSGT